VVKGREAADVRYIDFASCSAQLLYGRDPIMDDCCVQRGHSCSVCRIKVRPARMQELDDCDGTPRCCKVERRHSLRVAAINVLTGIYGFLHIRQCSTS
jgi:hypothetical protein